jgi:hypothetical protein
MTNSLFTRLHPRPVTSIAVKRLTEPNAPVSILEIAVTCHQPLLINILHVNYPERQPDKHTLKRTFER